MRAVELRELLQAIFPTTCTCMCYGPERSGVFVLRQRVCLLLVAELAISTADDALRLVRTSCQSKAKDSLLIGPVE